MTDDVNMTKKRNVATAIAYFLLAVMAGFFTVGAALSIIPSVLIMIIFEILVGVCGVYLLVLGKRDLTATVMLMFALIFGYYTVTGGVVYSVATPVILIFFIIVAFMMLTTGEKKASTYFCVFLPYGIGALSMGFAGGVNTVTIIMHAVFGVVALIYAILLLSNGKSKTAKNLQSDDNFSFKESGSVLGYVVMMIPFCVFAVSSIIPLADKMVIGSMIRVCAVSMIVSGILLIIFAKKYFKPVLYILSGVVWGVLVLISSNESLYIIVGICSIVIGLLFLVEKDGRILNFLLFVLPGILLILLSFTSKTPVMGVIFTGIPMLIAIYMALSYFCKKTKLPRF